MYLASDGLRGLSIWFFHCSLALQFTQQLVRRCNYVDRAGTLAALLALRRSRWVEDNIRELAANTLAMKYTPSFAMLRRGCINFLFRAISRRKRYIFLLHSWVATVVQLMTSEQSQRNAALINFLRNTWQDKQKATLTTMHYSKQYPMLIHIPGPVRSTLAAEVR